MNGSAMVVPGHKRLTRLFLRLVQDANDSGCGRGEPVKNHKRILADDKLSVRGGFQLVAYLLVLGYLRDGLPISRPILAVVAAPAVSM